MVEGDFNNSIYGSEIYEQLYTEDADELGVCNGTQGNGGLCEYDSYIKLGTRPMADVATYGFDTLSDT